MRRLALVAFLLLVPGQGAAQPPAGGDIPRTAWGAPDLGGVWTNSTLTPLERPEEYGDREFHTAEEVAELQPGAVQGRIDALPEPEATLAVEFSEIWMEPGPLSGRTSLVTGPTGKIPAYPAAAQVRLADGLRQPTTQRADSHDDRGYSERCLRFVTGGPPMMAFPFAPVLQIFQTPDHVVIQTEENHEIRVVHLDGRPGINPRIRLWRGDSRGRWEGDTLVVETVNFNGKGGFRGSADALHLTERFTRVDGDTILYEFTADDPGTWTEPWTAEMPLKVSPAPLYEHACHEGNYSLPLVLSGARAQERAGETP
ncbi:MAG: hypothetical protein F4Y57_11730 [Acidobacteria bacterium]|nr:hypothetical protein [Acidobacteriota bacterium]